MAVEFVETETLGVLEFLDGLPRPGTVQKIYNNLDLLRSTTAFLIAEPIATLHATLGGLRRLGIEPSEIGIFEILPDKQPVGGSVPKSICGMCSQIDLRTGPVVLGVPPGCSGVVVDACFNVVVEICRSGPSEKNGEKFLFVPPGHKVTVTDEYRVFRSSTFDHLVILTVDGSSEGMDTRFNLIKEQLNIFPLVLADSPPLEIFHCNVEEIFNTDCANGFRFFEELNEVIQKEPADAFSPELTGTLASVGIKRGVPFAPDARMKRILTEAAAIGSATALALTFNPRRDSAFTYPDRNWTLPFVGGGYDWMDRRVRRALTAKLNETRTQS